MVRLNRITVSPPTRAPVGTLVMLAIVQSEAEPPLAAKVMAKSVLARAAPVEL